MCNVPPKFYQVCRLCLSCPDAPDSDVSLSIFENDIAEASRRNIPNKIMTCLSILVSEKDPLPQVICLQCAEQLDALFRFRDVAQKAERILLQFIMYTQQLKGTPQEKLKQSTATLETMIPSTRNTSLPISNLKTEVNIKQEQLPSPPSLREDADNIEPADLSRRPEAVTCVPEIEFLKEEPDDEDANSEYSNSSDPERLEVDMSQVAEEESNSTTTSAYSPPSPSNDNHHNDEAAADGELWRALSQNGHSPGMPLAGEASQLLRKLITCRKLGMSITPAPPHKPIDNRITFVTDGNSLNESLSISKASGRRKQNFPTKAPLEEPNPRDVSPCRDVEQESDYIPDFTGNSPWCNLQIVKTKGGAGMARRVDLACSNCGTQTTTIWRRNIRGEMVCNACGLYFKLHGVDRPHTMRRDTIHTRRRRPKGAGGGGGDSGNADRERHRLILPKKANSEADTEDMLSALRRQIQPHLVMALQGHNNHNSYTALQAHTYPVIIPKEESPGGSAPEGESDDDDDNIADLPLNLVSTQLTETETH